MAFKTKANRGSSIRGANSYILAAQHGRKVAYAKPTGASDAKVGDVAYSEELNRAVVTDETFYIQKRIGFASFGMLPNIARLEDDAIGASVDRSKGQPGPYQIGGDVVIPHAQAGMEVWLQNLLGDRDPTITEVGPSGSEDTVLNYAFTPNNNPPAPLTLEITKAGTQPDRAFGVLVNSLSFDLNRNTLSAMTMNMIGLEYQINTAGNTAATGTDIPPATDGQRTIDVVTPIDASSFDSIPARSFPGWAAKVLTAGEDFIRGFEGSFSYNNNWQIDDELIGEQGGAAFNRGDNDREASLDLNVVFTRGQLQMAYDYLQDAYNGGIKVQFNFTGADSITRKLEFVIGNSVFENMPIPPIDTKNRLRIPLQLRLLPSLNMNDILTINYTVPTSQATQLQAYS